MKENPGGRFKLFNVRSDARAYCAATPAPATTCGVDPTLAAVDSEGDQKISTPLTPPPALPPSKPAVLVPNEGSAFKVLREYLLVCLLSL